MSRTVFVVDDTEIMRRSMTEILQSAGHRVRAFDGAEEVLQEAVSGEVDGVVTDLKMGGMDGLGLLKALHRSMPTLPVIVVTAHGTVRTAVEAMKEGAFDYLTKPFEADELEVVVEKALSHASVCRENSDLRRALASRVGFEVLGTSAALQGVREQITRIARTDSTVLIQGESGTGKEVVARALHAAGPRQAAPFYAVNCAALSAGLLESELFGHERGAFTGADRRRRGRFELADGGTLLLDEVTEMDERLQAKLLRVLQERSFERVGSSEPIRVDVRVIATSNRDIQEALRRGNFRKDLYYRLAVVPVVLPPLRERIEDLPVLVRHFLDRFADWGWRTFREVEPEAMELMQGYSWPGNVRELGNVLERAVALHPGPVLKRDFVEPALVGTGGGSVRVDRADEGGDPEGWVGVPLEEVERRLIAAALRRYKGRRRETAVSLGIAERTLREKIRRWNLSV
jgi:DNA-binding NtrC family response regulator